MVKEGKFDYIGLSEVKAETVRRAHKVRSIFL
jgi:aryl-alcohol dehydrogenase-like predicted oxidoreductase